MKGKKILVFALLMLLALPLALAGCDDNKNTAATWTKGTGTFVNISSEAATADAGDYAYMFDATVLADESTEGTSYLGHPDSVLLDNGNILTAFPLGHGRGETEMMLSEDRGLTWTSIFDADNAKPESFYDTQETPTLYKLNFADGTQKLICISARPGWVSSGSNGEGFDVTVSTSLDADGGCDGLVWSEHENFYGPNATREEYRRERGDWAVIVGMSSLTQLKDENGNFIDKWMGTFHTYDMIVYKTYLTFDEDGNMEWTEPMRLLGQNDEYRYVEGRYQFCEAEVLRSPDGKELAILFRCNYKRTLSYVSFSTDEGETWSEPQTVSAELTGERHKAEYDPATGKLIITFRSVYYKGSPSNGNWYSKGWLAWVGDYEDLKAGSEGKGDMLIKLAHTYGSGTEASEEANADTGYAGLVIYDDGLVVTCSYGTFSPANDPTHGGDTYIVAKQFKVNDLASCFDVTVR